MSRSIATVDVTDDQAEGFACIMCGVDFADQAAPAAVPVQLPATGRQVFVCTPECPEDRRPTP